tara:strand:+ start:273 stop:587 length:315 start_codon:yes stop_codon:yes gene_type:complete
MKSFKQQIFVRDSDDLCQVAVFIAKKLLDQDDSNAFSRELLTTISSVRDYIDEKKDSGINENNTGARAFGLYSQVPIINSEKANQRTSLKELKEKYHRKLMEKI